jgi:hypothetical protein
MNKPIINPHYILLPLLHFALLLPWLTAAQSGNPVVGYSYDGSGNRTGRALLLKSSDTIQLETQEPEVSPTVTSEEEPALEGMFTIYPNPFSGYLYIDVDERAENYDIRVYTSSGRMVYHRMNNRGSQKLYFGNSEKGTLLVQIKCGKETTTHKIIRK